MFFGFGKKDADKGVKASGEVRDDGCERIGILGGTFNPPHIGHINAAKAALEGLGLSRVILIPAGEPPHKKMPEGSATSRQRLDMTRLAARELPDAEVDDVEINRSGPSYTVDTLEYLRGKYPDAKLYLICGTDMFLTLEMWKSYERIFELACPVVASREEDDRESLEKHAKLLTRLYGVETAVLGNSVIDISSSELRAELCTGGGSELVPERVLEYIRKNKLYGVK